MEIGTLNVKITLVLSCRVMKNNVFTWKGPNLDCRELFYSMTSELLIWCAQRCDCLYGGFREREKEGREREEGVCESL